MDILYQRLRKIVQRLPSIAKSECLLYGRSVFLKTRMNSHVQFIRTCLSENIIPNGFRIKTHHQFTHPGLLHSSQRFETSFSKRIMRLKLYEFDQKFKDASERITSSIDALNDLISQEQLSRLKKSLFNLNSELKLSTTRMCPWAYCMFMPFLG